MGWRDWAKGLLLLGRYVHTLDSCHYKYLNNMKLKENKKIVYKEIRERSFEQCQPHICLMLALNSAHTNSCVQFLRIAAHCTCYKRVSSWHATAFLALKAFSRIFIFWYRWAPQECFIDRLWEESMKFLLTHPSISHSQSLFLVALTVMTSALMMMALTWRNLMSDCILQVLVHTQRSHSCTRRLRSFWWQMQ